MRDLVRRLGGLRLNSSLTHSSLARFFGTTSELKKSHYETLDVPSTASKKEIRDAYIRLSKLNHPDHDPSDPSLHSKFVAIQEAYDTLSSVLKRKEYDVNVTNFHHHHPRSSAQFHGRPAPGWDHQQGASEGPFKERKSRAFWTDPSYHKPKSSHKKMRIFGREFDVRNTNKLIALGSLLWMTFGTAFVYIYVKYIYGQREAILMDRQRRLAVQYNATRDKARAAESNREIIERFTAKQMANSREKDD